MRWIATLLIGLSCVTASALQAKPTGNEHSADMRSGFIQPVFSYSTASQNQGLNGACSADLLIALAPNRRGIRNRPLASLRQLSRNNVLLVANVGHLIKPSQWHRQQANAQAVFNCGGVADRALGAIGSVPRVPFNRGHNQPLVRSGVVPHQQVWTNTSRPFHRQ